jgi:hypothetical protein
MLLGVALARSACADAIVFPAPSAAPDRPLEMRYRFAAPTTGRGVLHIEWRDAAGRIVERRSVGFDLHAGRDIVCRLDTARAVSILNRVRAYATFRGGARRGPDVTASFLVPPARDAWRDYQIIMWQPQTAAADEALARIGVSAGKIQANRTAPRDLPHDEMAPILASNLRFYVENIATDFYSAYHRWFPDHAVNWRFLAAQQLYRRGDPAAFLRDPSLSDPQWLKRIHDRVVQTVTAFRPYRPLYYNLGDETGIADLAAYWDFDFSPASLAAMRRWLATQYPDLAALNREWGTDFPRWNNVVPPTTDAAMRRKDENFAAWGDFKEWMDVAFARAIAMGRDAVHGADPHADAAIEGGQVPGWGGYDYARLVHSVDVIEAGDENVELVHSLAPGLVILTTSFGSGDSAARPVWSAFLAGARGLILWDDAHEFVNDAGVLGDRGRTAAPYFRALRHGLGALVIGSRRLTSPIDIVYSPPSMRVQWLRDWKDKGDAWTHRGSAEEGGADNTVRAAMAAYADAVEALGYAPRFVSAAALAAGALRHDGARIVVLPHAIALSPAAAEAIRRFVAAGGTAIADTMPGSFDAHGRRLDWPLLADLFGKSAAGRRGIGRRRVHYLVPAPTGADATTAFGPGQLTALRAIFAQAGVAPLAHIRTAAGAAASNVDIHGFRDGGVTILGLMQHRADKKAAPIVLSLPRQSQVYDLRARKSLGRGDRFSLGLDPLAPTLLAIAPARLPRPSIFLPAPPHQGDVATLGVALAGPSEAAFHILHVAVTDPAGRTVTYYSGNLRLRHRRAAWRIPLALNDPAGTWRVRVTDALSGESTTVSMPVLPQPRVASRRRTPRALERR